MHLWFMSSSQCRGGSARRRNGFSPRRRRATAWVAGKSFPCCPPDKAPEDWRTPRRFALAGRRRPSRQRLGAAALRRFGIGRPHPAQRRRRGIFVEPRPTKSQAPSGATYSPLMPRLTELEFHLHPRITKIPRLRRSRIGVAATR